MKIKRSSLIKTVIFITLIFNMIGILLVYSKHFKTLDNDNILDFIPSVSSVYDRARETLFWIAFVLLLMAWFFWELSTTKRGKKIFAILSIFLLLIEMFVFLNLLTIISVLVGIFLKAYLTMHKEYSKKNSDEIEIVL